MKKHDFKIDTIPATLWGAASKKLFIAVHGDLSNKEDTVIAILAEEAAAKGYQTLSFDLPEHGERSSDPRLCSPQNCAEDLRRVIQYARTLLKEISLFGCSIGAYFSMLAFQDESFKQSIFLSPVVDMERIIKNMMIWFNISEEKLQQELEIVTPVKTLYWDYYQYVIEHPLAWSNPTTILYGAKDELCEFNYVKTFAEQVSANMTVMEDAEHFFHTEKQLAFFRQWLSNNIIV